jgi:hypothetical protein
MPQTLAPQTTSEATQSVVAVYRNTITRAETSIYISASVPSGTTLIVAASSVTVPVAYFVITGPGASNIKSILVATAQFKIFFRFTDGLPFPKTVYYTGTTAAQLSALSVTKFGAAPSPLLMDTSLSMPSCYYVTSVDISSTCPGTRRREALDFDDGTVRLADAASARREKHHGGSDFHLVLGAAAFCTFITAAAVAISRRKSAVLVAADEASLPSAPTIQVL